MNTQWRWTIVLGLLVPLCLAGFTSAQGDTAWGEWGAYSGDAGSTKYSPLDQIGPGNIQDLRVAWIWETSDSGLFDSGVQVWHGSFEATPLVVGGRMYVVTPLNQAVALDPETGSVLWRYDPKSYKSQRMGPNKGFIHRGLAYWSDGDDARIVYGTVDGWLIALDAETGEPSADFGEHGRVDLTKGLRKPVARNGTYGVNSPVVICRDVVVTGSTVMDSWNRKEGIPGDVRGFDVRTGEQLWTFHTVAQPGEYGAETWEDGSNVYSGSANVWAPYSADEELGFVYLPVTSSTSDYYGGDRLGDNLFTQSLVCLNAKTGERVWHFQTTHHGLWDYDLPAAPILMDITVNGKRIKAVAQLSKQAFTYVFDRITGEPVWPIEERSVLQSTVPGERTSPTQPFPTKPPPFDRQGFSEDDVIDFTPEIKAEALRILDPYTLGPLYTPPSVEGTMVMPGFGGGANWNGGAFDPETGVLYVPSLTLATRYQLGPPDPARSRLRYGISDSIVMAGPFGLPLVKPPWARITAIDMNKGEHLWTVPHGSPIRTMDDLPGDLPQGIKEKVFEDLLGTVLGGAVFSPLLVTKTLLFAGIGRASGSPRRDRPLFQAFDKATGKVVWEIELPSSTTGGPMTYISGGKQYIAVATGGGRSGPPAKLVALSLP